MKVHQFVLFLTATSICVATAGVIYEPYTITTVFGWGGTGSQDGTGVEARFSYPRGGVFDRAGNLYLSDGGNQTIRKITPAGVVTTFAGSPGQSGSDDGQGSAARFSTPAEIGIDRAGNLYVADHNNHTIRKITPSAVVTTLAGLAGSYGYVDGQGSDARFDSPFGVVVDRSDNIFVADTSNDRIRKVTLDGTVTTFAGGGPRDQDGTGTEAGFYTLKGLGIDKGSNIYATEWFAQQVRKITPDAVVTHFNWLGEYGKCEDAAVDLAGNVYAADTYGTISKTPPVGDSVIFAGTKFGSEDGKGTKAQFNSPLGVVFDTGGNLFVTDEHNHNVRRITPEARVTTFAGLSSIGSRDAVGIEARFFWPHGVVSDGNGGFYVCDSQNALIRKIDSSGAVTTVAGKAYRTGLVDGNGSRARFNYPTAIARSGSGNFYIADSENNAVRKLDADNNVTTLAPGTDFHDPKGIAVDVTGNVFVSSEDDGSIYKITPAGDVSVFVDGFIYPTGLAFDNSGDLFFAEAGRDLIHKVSPTGTVSIVAGSGKHGNTDGPALQSSFRNPKAVAVDGMGNVFVTDHDNDTVRKVSTTGLVTTLAGSPREWSWVDGTGAAARFTFPFGIIVEPDGSLYIADYSYANSIRKGVPAN